MQYRIVTSLEQLKAITNGWSGYSAVDTETYGQAWDEKNRRLLGISISPQHHSNGIEGIYIPFNSFQNGLWKAFDTVPLLPYLQSYLNASKGLIGHNYTYDKRWLEIAGLMTIWHADTRIMWHLASAPAGPRSYGLKDAQKELLGWKETNETELEVNVKAKGGKLSNGDHYMADIDILARYACIDTLSTIAVYSELASFFNKHEYWWMLHKMMHYNQLLEQNTFDGILVDLQGLQKAHNRLLNIKEAARKRFTKELKHEIDSIEQDWADRRASLYKREYNKSWYLNHSERWKRFNLNSDADKRELFYEKLGHQVEYHTDSGAPSVNADAIKRFNGSYVQPYLTYEHANTISTNFSGPYIDAASSGRLHPGFNICGTVSYRLSGFKPYLLNAPFDEKRVLKHIKVDEGWAGVHADLSAIEPTITAHYSEDKALLKVFRDGLGDIYLDLALELFPNDRELREGYDPNIPIAKAVKERFAKQRKVAKVIQLAVQYTGTEHTVSRNLSKEGIETDVWTARGYVQAYWRKFHKVAEFNRRLFELNRKDGLLRNVIGRIIRVPSPDYKDLPNRFIQSSAHDVLIIWVQEIYRLCASYGIDIKPILLDCHDSTSNQCDSENVSALKTIYQEALDNINKQLGLCVTIRAEIKTFSTLAGLKNDE